MSKNVFADLELPDPEECLLKAELVLAIRRMVRESRMTQAQLAERAGMAQPHVSRLLSGMTKDISVEKLLRVITALGHDVRISIENLPQIDAEGRLRRGDLRVSGEAAPAHVAMSK